MSSSSLMRRKPSQARSQERVKRILSVAEELFANQGYNATTTNAIATVAKIPIGSLYQFFPDKAAILQALGLHYNELLRQRLKELALTYSPRESLSVYITESIDLVNQFFADYPGYYATYLEMQGTMSELETIEANADVQFIEDFVTELYQVNPGLHPTDYQAIAFVLVKAIGTLLWLSVSQDQEFRQRLVAETKRMTLSYLESYFTLDPINDENNKPLGSLSPNPSPRNLTKDPP